MRENGRLLPFDGWGGYTASAVTVMTVDFIIAIGSTFQRQWAPASPSFQQLVLNTKRNQERGREKTLQMDPYAFDSNNNNFYPLPCAAEGANLNACIEANAINLEAKEKTCKSVCTLLVDGVIVSPLTIPCHKTRRTFSPSRRSWKKSLKIYYAPF